MSPAAQDEAPAPGASEPYRGVPQRQSPRDPAASFAPDAGEIF